MKNHDSSGKERLNEEFGIPRVQTLGVCKSICVKYLVEGLKYESLVAHHFMYMANVVLNEETTCFDEVICS